MDWWQVLFLLFLAIGLIIGLYGLKKNSILTILSGISFILIPIFFAKGWYFFFLFFPPLMFVFSNRSKEK